MNRLDGNGAAKREARAEPAIPVEKRETVEHIQSMLAQLKVMADNEGCDFLAYMISMAHIEASDISRGLRPLRVGRDKSDPATGMPLDPAGKVKLQ